MSKLIETPVFLQIFNLEEPTGFNDDNTFSLIPLYDKYLEKVKDWADKNYPKADVMDRCSFAGLILYFVTGYYGGYGTEGYAKEHVCEQRVYAFVNHNSGSMTERELSKAVIELCIRALLLE